LVNGVTVKMGPTRIDVSRLSAMGWKRLRYGKGLRKRMRRSWPMWPGNRDLRPRDSGNGPAASDGSRSW